MSRTFMLANARIVPSESSGLLLVTDTSMNLKKLYEIIKDADVKPTPEMKRRWQEQDKQAHRQAQQRRMSEGAPQVPGNDAQFKHKS